MDAVEGAYWLSRKEQQMVRDAIKGKYFQTLPNDQQLLLLPLLLAILYTEKELTKNGKQRTRYLESLLERLKLERFFCSTLSVWNVHLSHHERFDLSKKEFRSTLQDPVKAAHIVMVHLVEDIGLNKAPELIFAEYNHNVLCTSLVALQKALNRLTQEENRIEEDGLTGPSFEQLVKSCSSHLPAFFSLERLDEEMILQTVRYLNEKEGFSLEPAVPERVIKKDFKFLMKSKRLASFFERDINVPLYVEYGMKAFDHLQKEGGN